MSYRCIRSNWRCRTRNFAARRVNSKRLGHGTSNCTILLPWVISISENGVILEANVTGASLLGVGRNDLSQRPLTRFILPEDQDIYYKHRRQLFATQSSQVCELRMIRKMLPLSGQGWKRRTPQDDERRHSPSTES